MSNAYILPPIVKQVNNMKLQNTVMQLRKVCSHPFLFDWPLDPVTHQPALNDDLVNLSGKMMVLDRLLRELFKRKHKVLLFSQFTTMLDIIEVCEINIISTVLVMNRVSFFRTGHASLWGGKSAASMVRPRPSSVVNR